MKNLSPIHMTPEEKLAASAENNAELLGVTNQHLHNLNKTAQKLDEITENTKPEKVANALLSVLKGDFKGDRGESPTKDELLALIKPLIPAPLKGKDGKSVIEGQVIQKILSKIPVPKDGEKGDIGEKGEDGSPDTADDIIAKINPLKNVLDFQILTNIPDFLLAKDIGQSGGGGGGQQIVFRNSASAQISAYVTDLQFGTGITPTYANGKITLTSNVGTVTSVASADGSITVTNPTTTVDLAVVSSPKLTTARTINGVSFDGTANITVTAAAGTLTGTTLAANVLASSLTSVGTLLNLTVTNTITGSISGNAATVTTNANLTGVITSVGNATSIASQTGTGTKFVVDTSPTIITPTLTTSATVPLIVGGSGTTQTLTLKTTSGVGAAGADIIFQTGNNGATEAMRILNNGNVGIGTTSPAFKLDVFDTTTPAVFTNSRSQDTIGYVLGLRTQRSGANGGVGLGAGINLQASNSIGTIRNLADINSAWLSPTSGAETSYLEFSTMNAGTLAEAMRILNNGNVGIGTTAPTNLLSLGGQAAQIFWLERNTTANTAGNSLTVQSGGATAAATDKNAGDLILATGLSTGTGKAQVRVQAPTIATTGTADNTLVNRIIINGTVNLTTAVAATIATVTAATLKGGGGHVVYSIFATDGTDIIEASGQVAFSIVNKAAVYTGVTSVLGAEAVAKSNGTHTIANTWAFSSNALQITSTLGVIGAATTFNITYTVVSNSQQAITAP